jgi:hypothetical protein
VIAIIPEQVIGIPGTLIGIVRNPQVSIVADVEGADVYIDGKMVGETPATFTLPSGIHKVEVKDQNGQSWQRELEVLDDSEVKLTAKIPKQ